MPSSQLSAEPPVVVTVRGELDASDPDWTAELAAALKAGDRRVVLDMLSVSFIDSSVVRTLVDAYRRLHAGDGWLRVVYTHHLIRRVIAICGLSTTLPQYTSVAAALRGSPSAVQHDDAGYADVEAESPYRQGPR